nr:hypothetical protein [Bacillaceae bacterium]
MMLRCLKRRWEATTRKKSPFPLHHRDERGYGYEEKPPSPVLSGRMPSGWIRKSRCKTRPVHRGRRLPATEGNIIYFLSVRNEKKIVRCFGK